MDRKEKIFQGIKRAMNKQIFRDTFETEEEGLYVGEAEEDYVSCSKRPYWTTPGGNY